MADLRFDQVCEQLGIENYAAISKKELTDNFVVASIVGLADGDMVGIHTPYADERMVSLYGRTAFHEGEVASRSLRVALENGLVQTPIYNWQSFLAETYDSAGPILQQASEQSVMKIRPDHISIDGNVISLPKLPGVVVHYSACLSSRSIIKDQLDFIKANERPFVYAPLTRLHFTNQVLLNTYDQLLGPGGARTAMDERIYIGREDGSASATDEIIKAQQEHNGPTEIADVILCPGLDHTTLDELKHSINNAHRILKEDGKLVIRTVALPSQAETGTDEIAGWAFEAGFSEKSAMYYGSVSHILGKIILTGNDAPREMKTVVLSK